MLQDGHPPLGWPDTIAYLVLPALLVVSQYISAQVLQPPQVSFFIDQAIMNVTSYSTLVMDAFFVLVLIISISAKLGSHSQLSFSYE